MSFSIIAAIGKNRELGKGGKLLWRLPEDLAFFKKTTLGHPVLMGRKTFESLPGMLPQRKHYVVTRSGRLSIPSAAPVARSRRRGDPPTGTGQPTLISDLSKFIDSAPDEEIFVIGGGQIYAAMLPYADTLYLTEVDATDEAADTFFPEFDKNDYNREVLGKGAKDGISYQFVKYTRK